MSITYIVSINYKRLRYLLFTIEKQNRVELILFLLEKDLISNRLKKTYLSLRNLKSETPDLLTTVIDELRRQHQVFVGLWCAVVCRHQHSDILK